MGKVMLEVNNLKTKYVTRFHEDVFAVDGVSLKIEEGKSFLKKERDARLKIINEVGVFHKK